MPSISQQSYIDIYVGVDSTTPVSEWSLEVCKEIAKHIENGTAFDILLHFVEGSVTRLLAAYKTQDDPYFIVFWSAVDDELGRGGFSIE